MSSETTISTADHLAELLAQLSYREGTFRLASGRESDFYVDVKQTVFTAEGAALIGALVCRRLAAHRIELVGGMALGAIPLVTAALCEAARRGQPLSGFFVRKEIKDHGTSRRLDGCFDPSRSIALLEDVVTTGESTLAAIDSVEAAGGRVSLLITVVDREESGGMGNLAARVPCVESLATRTSIVGAFANTKTR